MSSALFSLCYNNPHITHDHECLNITVFYDTNCILCVSNRMYSAKFVVYTELLKSDSWLLPTLFPEASLQGDGVIEAWSAAGLARILTFPLSACITLGKFSYPQNVNDTSFCFTALLWGLNTKCFAQALASSSEKVCYLYAKVRFIGMFCLIPSHFSKRFWPRRHSIRKNCEVWSFVRVRMHTQAPSHFKIQFICICMYYGIIFNTYQCYIFFYFLINNASHMF